MAEVDRSSEQYGHAWRVAHARSDGAWQAHELVERYKECPEEARKVAFLLVMTAMTEEEQAFADGFEYRCERMLDEQVLAMVNGRSMVE